ncbi:Vesicle-associated protein 1-2 [Coccomyxa sp. Obi]|nr:Vesicle-associated protein 1-2 [Coccomyxa sp. Obi]
MAETVSKGINASDLSIQPTELKFRFELRKNIPVTLSLHNPGQEKVAFKVKTTSPKKYCVRPSSGVVEPGATKDVQVIMQAQREYPPTLADCKDKFLVQTVKVSTKVTEITPDLFDGANASNIKQSKLRVVLVGPPKPPSPVPEGVEEETAPSPGGNAFTSENGDAAGVAVASRAQDSKELATITQERNKLREQLNKVEKDKSDIKKRLDLLQLQAEGRPRGDVTQKSLISGPYTLVHLLIVALLAFFLGHYL